MRTQKEFMEILIGKGHQNDPASLNMFSKIYLQGFKNMKSLKLYDINYVDWCYARILAKPGSELPTMIGRMLTIHRLNNIEWLVTDHVLNNIKSHSICRYQPYAFKKNIVDSKHHCEYCFSHEPIDPNEYFKDPSRKIQFDLGF